MTKRWNRKLILAKQETTPGTKEVLSAADAVLVSAVENTPLAGDTVSRDLLRPYYGASADINVNVHQSIEFTVELAASGTAETAPPWGRLLAACGLAETITSSGTKQVAYTPVSSGEKTLTIGLNIDGVLHTLVGCRGTFTLEFAVNAVPKLAFTFTGHYAAPTDTAAVANPVYSAWKPPVIPSNSATPTFSLLGKNGLALTALSLDYGNEVVYREVIGAAPVVEIVNRTPSGQLTIDAPSVATLSLVERAKAGTPGALRLVHGNTAGAIVELDMPAVALSQPSYSEANGVWQMQANYKPLPNVAAGNDEIKITTK